MLFHRFESAEAVHALALSGAGRPAKRRGGIDDCEATAQSVGVGLRIDALSCQTVTDDAHWIQPTTTLTSRPGTITILRTGLPSPNLATSGAALAAASIVALSAAAATRIAPRVLPLTCSTSSI